MHVAYDQPALQAHSCKIQQLIKQLLASDCLQPPLQLSLRMGGLFWTAICFKLPQ